MSRPATARLKVNPPVGRMPVLQFCAPGELRIDADYQRSIEANDSVTLIRRIAVYWNWDLCQPLVVSRRTNGDLYVIDGQHRLAAAKMRSDIAQLPCVIVDCGSPADEAASFVHLNQQRRPLSKLDLFRAAVASEDGQALAISAAMAAAGLSLAPHTNHTVWKPGMVANIGGIERAWTREGSAPTKDALRVLGRAFTGQVLRYAGTLFRGIVRICRDEHRAHGRFLPERFDRLVGMMGAQSQDQWIREINRFFAENPEMFRGEAADNLLRQKWRSLSEGRTASVPARVPQLIAPRNAGPVTNPKGEGFGLGASDFEGDEVWVWCEQCDCRRNRGQVAACMSQFCKPKALAA